MKPLISHAEAVDYAFDPRLYSGDPLPDGGWFGVLDFRIWGKDKGCLHCYFTDNDGHKRRVAAFPFGKGAPSAYGARDGALDMAVDNLEDLTFRLVTGKNGVGKPVWRAAAPP